MAAASEHVGGVTIGKRQKKFRRLLDELIVLKKPLTLAEREELSRPTYRRVRGRAYHGDSRK